MGVSFSLAGGASKSVFSISKTISSSESMISSTSSISWFFSGILEGNSSVEFVKFIP